MFFEPNQGQTASPVKFLAHGAGYGLFLTADEAVLQLQRSKTGTRQSVTASSLPGPESPNPSDSVIRMRIEGANSSASVFGASPLPGKSNYIIGNDPSKWRRDIPQFARVEYQAVYPGVNLVYYGDQGQLEYDFRIAPGADPNQIALSFKGATAHILAGNAADAGDLVLSTANGDVRFHAPLVYQQKGNNREPVAGSFRQLADNKIAFTVGAYDHKRELVIDPVLSYSSYLGGSGTEGGLGLVKIAVDSANFIYVAGSTNSADFPIPPDPPANSPYQAELGAHGATNVFIAVINTNPDIQQGGQQLVYATYLGGSATDFPVGIAVNTALDSGTSGYDVYVAGTTTSSDFPTSGVLAPFQTGPQSGTHGFVTRLNIGTKSLQLRYSTYLAGNGTDNLTGMAIDGSGNAYVTGDTTSNSPVSNGFPANANGYQLTSNTTPGNPQFFATKISTTGSGPLSMIYSTFFGGGNPAGAIAIGGGIAVDPAPNSGPNMYITGTTNMLPVAGPNPGELPFPLFNAQQACLNEAGNHGTCNSNSSTALDGFVAKINPNPSGFGQNPVYSTYLGAEGDDYANAIDVDSSGNAYITGRTNSTLWQIPAGAFQTASGGGYDAFIAKIGNVSGAVVPLTYFTYLGGAGDDSGQDIKVDSVQTVHVVGSTNSPSASPFPVTPNTVQALYGGGANDAFVAAISTTTGGTLANPIGDFSSYLGGANSDQGTGVAIDIFGATYVAGTTMSSNFPVTTASAAYPTLNGPQDAFITRIGSTSTLNVSAPNTSPSPNPVAAGTQASFVFDITNANPNGTDPANLVFFTATGLPTSCLATTPTATITSGTGTCGKLQGSTISCTIPTLAVNAMASVEVDVTPSSSCIPSLPSITIGGSASANNGAAQSNLISQTVGVVDFSVQAFPASLTINAGDTATYQIVFKPSASSSQGYNATITPSETSAPSIVTSTTVFNPTTVTLSGTGQQTTTLSITTVARPVTTGSLFRRGSFYATWFPIGGLSLAGLGIGVGRRRRRWMIAAILCLIAGTILLQPGCGSSSTSTNPTGGTLAGTYNLTITGSAGSSASHTYPVQLIVR